MRVLLTGASGFLGAHVLKHLAEKTDWDFLCPYTMRHQGSAQRLSWALKSGGPHVKERFTLFQHDCATPIIGTAAKITGDVDMILNFASDTHPPRSVIHPVEFVHNNVDIALYLLEYARTRDTMPLFVQISTNSVYGPAEGNSSHPEWDAIIPNNPYGASKVAQEALAISYWRSYNLPVLILNTMNPIGETQDTEKFIPNTIGKVLRGEQVEVHANAGGEVGSRTYIDAPEFVQALSHILAMGAVTMRDSGSDRPDRWHIAGREEIDNRRVAQIIADELGMELGLTVSAVDRPEHGHRYSLSGNKLWAAGWQASPTIEPAIRRIARWTAENRLWL